LKAAAIGSRQSPLINALSAVMGKLLVVVGLVIAAIGAAIMLGVPFGRLPGDIVVRKGAFTFYFPPATAVVLSLVLTFLLMLFRR
jgi:Protein of unknown function (DUF2905)